MYCVTSTCKGFLMVKPVFKTAVEFPPMNNFPILISGENKSLWPQPRPRQCMRGAHNDVMRFPPSFVIFNSWLKAIKGRLTSKII